MLSDTQIKMLLTVPQVEALKAAKANGGYWCPCGMRGFHRTAWSLHRLGLVYLVQPTVDPIAFPNETCSYVRGIGLTNRGQSIVSTI